MGNIRLYGSTSGYTELAPPAVAPDGVLSLPSGVGTIAKIESAWQDFTPTFTNLTVGNGTVVARYQQVEKTVLGYVSFTLGSTSSIGSGPFINVPVAGSSSIIDRLQVGFTTMADTGTATFTSVTSFRTGSPQTLTFGVTGSAGTYTNIGGPNSTSPFTWTTTDVLAMTFQYEAA